MKKVLALVLAGVFAAILTGCGGGGGGEGSSPVYIWGVANIHSDALYPKVVVVDWVGTTPVTLSRVAISRSSGGWQDITFGFTPPAQTQSSHVYSIAAINDANKDGNYQVSELLGFADCFLRWNRYAGDRGMWQIIEKNGDLRHYNAYEYSGKANIFIDAEFTRSMAATEPEAKEHDELEALSKINN